MILSTTALREMDTLAGMYDFLSFWSVVSSLNGVWVGRLWSDKLGVRSLEFSWL